MTALDFQHFEGFHLPSTSEEWLQQFDAKPGLITTLSFALQSNPQKDTQVIDRSLNAIFIGLYYFFLSLWGFLPQEVLVSENHGEQGESCGSPEGRQGICTNTRAPITWWRRKVVLGWTIRWSSPSVSWLGGWWVPQSMAVIGCR